MFETIKLGNNPTSIHTYQCAGCHSSLRIEMDGRADFDLDAPSQIAREKGWCRRQFHPAVNPWFCSRDCAHNSLTAKRWEDYWTNNAK
jgi:uncharacterized protein YlaI